MPLSVGHPRKYHTQEEQRQAHAESSARSYIKHRTKINKRRQRKYQGVHPPQGSVTPVHKNIREPPATESTKSLTKRLITRVLQKQEEFLMMIDHSPIAYAERMYLGFISTVTWKTPKGDDDELCQELMKIADLIQDVTKFEDRILNAAGVGDELAEVQHVREAMQEVERWLEDILCGTLEGVDILIRGYQDHTLLYQCVTK